MQRTDTTEPVATDPRAQPGSAAPEGSAPGAALRVAVCPDSFKGSLDAAAVAMTMERAVRASRPEAHVYCLPMADGGEGTARLICQNLGWAWQAEAVTGPDGATVNAGWGHDPEHLTAAMDVASACGFDQVSPASRNPWRLDTRGAGELLRSILDAGVRRVLVGLGGSTTVDGGAGLLAALGVRFIDAQDRELAPHPGGLAELYRVDFGGLDPRLADLELILLGDVDHPLTGTRGAAAVFGPQKGLQVRDVAAMDAHLQRLAAVIARTRSLHQPVAAPGTGAAGGLGFALACVLGGVMHGGAAYMADQIRLDKAICASQLVITGEGRLDAQTARGKVAGEVIRRARHWQVPVAVIAGSIACNERDRAAMGLAGARALSAAGVTSEQTMADPEHWIAVRTRELIESLTSPNRERR